MLNRRVFQKIIMSCMIASGIECLKLDSLSFFVLLENGLNTDSNIKDNRIFHTISKELKHGFA